MGAEATVEMGTKIGLKVAQMVDAETEDESNVARREKLAASLAAQGISLGPRALDEYLENVPGAGKHGNVAEWRRKMDELARTDPAAHEEQMSAVFQPRNTTPKVFSRTEMGLPEPTLGQALSSGDVKAQRAAAEDFAAGRGQEIVDVAMGRKKAPADATDAEFARLAQSAERARLAQLRREAGLED